MLKIDTSVITPTAGYPGLANNSALGTNPGVGLDFLQAEALQVADALGQSLASDTTKATILSSIFPAGHFLGFISGSGYVYFGGEIFYYPNTNLGPVFFGGPTNISATINPNPVDVSPNQTVLSDGVTVVSMHNQRTISFAYSYTNNPTGGGGTLPDFGYWIQSQVRQNTTAISTINSEITTINTELSSLTTVAPIQVVGGSGPAWQTGFGGNVKFWKDAAGLVHIWGIASIPAGSYFTGSPVTMFTLPAGYRPVNGMLFYTLGGQRGAPAGIQILNDGSVLTYLDMALADDQVGFTFPPFPTTA